MLLRSGLSLISLLALMSFALVSCGAPAARAMQDLAAIHDPSDWSPRSPASLSVAPESYLAEQPIRASGPGLYEIEDHRELELAILQSIASAPKDNPGVALEACAWLAIELLHDDFTDARVQAAAVLSSFAGNWIEKGAVRLEAPIEVDADTFARATQAFLDADEAGDSEGRVAALEALARMKAPSAVVAVRTLTGVARRIGATPLRTRYQERAFRFGAACVLDFLEAGSQVDDPVVAEACLVRLELLQKYAYPQASRTP